MFVIKILFKPFWWLFEQVKGEKLPEIPVEIKKGIKEYRKKLTKHVWPVIEKVNEENVFLCEITMTKWFQQSNACMLCDKLFSFFLKRHKTWSQCLALLDLRKF